MIGTSLASLLLACSGPGKTPEDSAAPPPEGPYLLSDADNYALSVQLNVPATATVERQDVLFSWPDLSRDMQCHDFDPLTEVDNVALIVFRGLSEEEIATGLAQDTLQQSAVSGYINKEVDGETSVALTDLTFFGTDPEILDQYYEGLGTWLLLLTTGTELAVGTRMLHFLRPTADETNDAVAMQDDCDIVDLDVDLAGIAPLRVAAEEDSHVFDWSGLTLTGQGGALDKGDIDSVMIGYYGDASLADLEQQFLDLELIADGLWTAPVSGASSVDLATAEGEDGLFPGFTETGLWVFALRCSTCASPAPLFLTLLDPV